MLGHATIVLGAGGPVGHAFHSGVLRALAEGLGADPRDARLVLGTSAGAQIGALLRAGMSAEDLMARVTGETMSEAGAELARHWIRPDHAAPGPGPASWRPASPRYLGAALRAPWRARPARLVSALLPRGRVCTQVQVEGLRRLFGDRWPARHLWITAVCLDSGERLALGQPGAPSTDVGTAVAASGAVPAVCAPIALAGRQLIDGGMASATHLDLLEEGEHDVVVVSAPLSMIPPMRLLLGREVRRLRARGKRVVVFEPREEASSAMGLDPMDLARCPAVARAAYRTVLRQLEDAGVRSALSPSPFHKMS